MKKIAIVVDSNSGITQAQGKALGVTVIPMPFTIKGKEFFEDISLTQEEFYQILGDGESISTSQPAVGVVLNIWDELLKENDEIIHIAMSSGLSQSCQTALFLANDYQDKVFVVDNKRISVTQRQSVLDALTLIKKGLSGKEIKAILEETRFESSIYIMVDTLKYLRRGGRVTAAGAALGALLKIKPVLTIQGDKLDAFAKPRGIKSAKREMLEAMIEDIKTRFTKNGVREKINLAVVHTHNLEAALAFKEEVLAVLPGYDIYIDNLSLSVACHIGPGALALACSKVIE